MTCIAYSAKHHLMAADSCCSDGDARFSTMQKIHRLKSGAVVGVRGVCDWRDLLALLEKATPRRMPTRAQVARLQMEVSALVVFPSRVLAKGTGRFTVACLKNGSAWSGEVLEVEDDVIAIGSGAPYAYGALDAGLSPEIAVKSACKRDLYCGGPIRMEKVT